MTSKWKLDPKSKPCLLFPSSKIVSSEHGQLLLDESILQGAIASCISTNPIISDATPVVIVSIVGSQSNEKYLLTKSLIQLYGNGNSGNKPGVLEALTPVLGSGIYLLQRPFILYPNGKNALPQLVFIFDLCRGETVDDQNILERFLLLASSMVVEIKQETEEHRILKQLDVLNANKSDSRWLPYYHNPICNHFLYVYPSDNTAHGLNSVATPNAKGKLKLKKIIKKSSSDLENRELENIGNTNIIEIKKLLKPLYEGSHCKDINLEKGMVQSLINSLEKISDVSELKQRMDQTKTAVNLGGLHTFMRSCVHSVNHLSAISSSSAPIVGKSAHPKLPGNGEIKPLATIHRPAVAPRIPSSSSSTTNKVSGTTGQGSNNRDLVSTHKSSVPLPPSPPKEFEGQEPSKQSKNTVMSTVNSVTRQGTSRMGYGVSTGGPVSGHGNHHQKPTQEKLVEDGDIKRKRNKMYENYLKAQTYLQRQIPDMTKSWINTMLSPNNIDKMIPNITTYMINIFNKRLLEDCLATTDSKLWTEMEQKVERYCKELSIAYLTEIQNRLKQFTSELNQKFISYKYFQPKELKGIGQQAYQMASQGLEGNRLEILTAGCQKIMTYFISHNEIIKNEMALVDKLMPRLTDFYNAEMGSIIKADIYSPTALDRIHNSLSDNLCQGLLHIFNFNEEGNNTIKIKLSDLLANALLHHVEENTENLKRATTAISRCLDKSKSFYVKEIENVLKENPNGLVMTSLADKNNSIIHDTLTQLESDIGQTVRKHEPVKGHVTSITNYINDYWKCVEDANRKLKNGLNSNQQSIKKQKTITPIPAQRNVSQPTSVQKPMEATKSLINQSTFPSTRASSSTSGSQNSSCGSSQEGKADPAELQKARQELERLLKEITEQMDTNKKFTNQKETARKLFRKKVGNFYGVYNNPESTLQEVQTQIRSLKIKLADLKG